jgi:hypothetical protein
MSISAANPAGLLQVSLCIVGLANESAPSCNGGGELHPCCDRHAHCERALILIALSSLCVHENFALESVCRYVSRLCSGTASGLFMRPAAVRSSASPRAALRVMVSLKILFGKSAEKISREPP